LSYEEELIAGLGGFLESGDGFLATHEEWHNHVREDDHIPQRKERKAVNRFRLLVGHSTSCATFGSLQQENPKNIVPCRNHFLIAKKGRQFPPRGDFI
jgi:hypothetical protein